MVVKAQFEAAKLAKRDVFAGNPRFEKITGPATGEHGDLSCRLTIMQTLPPSRRGAGRKPSVVATGNRHAGKTLSLADGKIVTARHDLGQYFSAYTTEIADLRDLGLTLANLAAQGDCLLILGERNSTPNGADFPAGRTRRKGEFSTPFRDASSRSTWMIPTSPSWTRTRLSCLCASAWGRPSATRR